MLGRPAIHDGRARVHARALAGHESNDHDALENQASDCHECPPRDRMSLGRVAMIEGCPEALASRFDQVFNNPALAKNEIRYA